MTSPERPGVIRAAYEEYDLAGTRIVMVSDPENPHAWIQSDVVTDNER